MIDKTKSIPELTFKLEINHDISRIWQMWTSESGLRSFLSPDIAVEFRPGGRFEIYFDMSQPEGMRGSEGMIVLALEKEHLFSFTWNSPPFLQDIRQQMTSVFISFTPLSPVKTLLYFLHTGFGQGKQWQESMDYFENAWGNIVLPRLLYALDHGAYPWENSNDPPALQKIIFL